MRASLLVSVVLFLACSRLAFSTGDGPTFQAVVEPVESVGLVLDASGVVETVLASEGEAVAAGDELLRLESGREEIRLSRAKVRQEIMAERLEQLLLKKQRYEELRDQGLVSEDQWSALSLEILDARLANADAEVEYDLAREDLLRRSLSSPVDGVVFRVSRRPGEGVRPLEVLVELVDIGSLRVNFFLPARFVGRFSVGEQVEVETQDGPVPAEVFSVDPFVDSATGVMRLTLHLSKDTGASPGDEVKIILADGGDASHDSNFFKSETTKSSK